MSKKKIESELLKHIIPLLEPMGFKFDFDKRELTNSYYFFTKETESFKYIQYLRFMKPNFIKCDSELKIKIFLNS